MSYIKWILYIIIPKKVVMNLRFLFLKFKVNKIKKKNNTIFILGTPKHGNLGDHAIISAEIEFFKNFFPEFVIIEIPLYIYSNHMHILKSIITDDIICVSGGGSLGTLWMDAENEIREIINVFNNNTVFIFPQTIYYENNEWGKCELRKSKQIYSMHKKLSLCAREKASYEFMKKEFIGNNVFYFPDMVLFLKKDYFNHKRNGILICTRNDKESIINESNKKVIYNIAKSYSNEVSYTDTVLPIRINNKTRKKYLDEKFSEFSKAELVITDRLHGMIFATVTGTPCIALNNYSHKVEGVYEWIQYLDYIQYVENVDEIKEHIGKLIKIGGSSYDKSKIFQYFEELSKVIHSKNSTFLVLS